MPKTSEKLYIALISIHGLIRGNDLELGRDADTGGQTLYVLELARSLARQSGVGKIDLITRRVVDPTVSQDYAEPVEKLTEKAQIIRIDAGPDEYINKEQLWDYLDIFTDNITNYFRENNRIPDILHSHYADAGYAGSMLSNMLGIPLIHTGHSLGRVKRARLLASGLSSQEVEERYNMSRRIEAEELVLATAERVITSTHQEIEEQYELYDYYQPKQMRVIPPGTDLERFTPTSGDELSDPLFRQMMQPIVQPDKPIILSLSRPDKRKNITALLDAYGQSSSLQELANLLIVAGNRDDIEDLDEGAQEVFKEILVAIDRYDLYGKVALPKHHSRDQVPLIYRIAAASGGIFVNPALTEPFGLTLIEAAASGLPIVATEDGGPRDIIGNCDNGFLIDPLDADTITQALVKLLNDKALWRQCADRGFEGVCQHYSWDAHAKQYLKLIRPIVKQTEKLVREPLQRRPQLYSDRAIFSDLDQNLVGDQDALKRLIEILRRQRKSTHFAIVTGRRLDSALKVMKKHQIPEPDILITSCGTEIFYAPKLTSDIAWARHIDSHWMPHKIKTLLNEFPGLHLQPKSEQSKFKISYFIDPSIAELDEIKRLLLQEEHAVHLQFAFGQFLDILPMRASKGLALRYVAERWQIPLERILVAGGSGADEDMLRGKTLAVVVANNHPEELSQLENLTGVYFAEKSFSAGILEALDYYDFFNSCTDPQNSL